ncbi:MAG: MerR family transcriptional regulator [Bradymonadia bacterium]
MSNPFDPYRTAELTLSQLVEVATTLLRRAPQASDERVSAAPDARTVRYYQTLGLVQRPSRYQGRTAIYGFVQLLQIICVRLLQARGYSLNQVQQALTGVGAPQLEAAALDGLGGGSPAPTPPTHTVTALTSAEVAPGVVITIDPRVVTQPEAIIQRISQLLNDPSTLTGNPGEETR